MKWRYQPVIHGLYDLRIHLVYIDDDGKLDSWIVTPCEPGGTSDQDELVADLTEMQMDTNKYVPVRFDKMTYGCTFDIREGR